MKQTIRKLLALLVVVAMSSGAWAQTKKITYLNYVGGTAAFAEASGWAEKITSESNNLSDWYYVEGTVTINRRLNLSGNTTIILCDGAELKINTTGDSGIFGFVDNLTIYAQSSGPRAGRITINSNYGAIIFNGTLTINGGIISATSDTENGISCNYLAINGGQVDATSNASGFDGIYAYNGITINGGQVTANGKLYGMSSDVGSGIEIKGGQVTATGSTAGIRTTGTITLGWTNATDFIKASSYDGTVETADGKAFYYEGAGSLTYNHSLDDDEKNAIAGKELTPSGATYHTVTVASDITGGNIEVDRIKAFEEERVVVYVTPNPGKMLTALSYTDGTNTYGIGTGTNDIKRQANDYVITMPDKDITVTATFATPIAEVYDGTTLKASTLTLSDAFQYIKTNGSGFSNAPTVKLLADTGDESGNTIGYTSGDIRDALLTIDLNSHTATFGDITTQSSLTIKNGTMTSAITCSDSGGGEYTFTLDNATMTSSHFTWGYHYMTLTNSSVLNVNTYSYLNGSTLDPLVLTFGDTSSSMNFVECTITTMGGKLSDLGNMVDYVKPGQTLVVDGTTTNNVSLRKDWGLMLISNFKESVTPGVPVATAKFFDGGNTEPVASTFDSTPYPKDGAGITMIDNSGDLAAGKDRYIIVYIKPTNNWYEGYYWTDEQLLLSYEAVGSLARSRAPGLDLPQSLHLLKRDTYTDDESVTHTCYDGTGWYYYKLPKEHNTAAGYTSSVIDGEVPQQFSFYVDYAERISMSGNVLTVTQDPDDPETAGWKAEITFDAETLSFPFDAADHKPVITDITIKRNNTKLVVAKKDILTETDDFDGLLTVGSDHRIGKCPIRLGTSQSSWFCYSLNSGNYGAYRDDASFDIAMPLTVADNTAPKGTAENPWRVRDVSEMNVFAKCVNVGEYSFNGEYVKLMNDLDYDEAVNPGANAGFKPVARVEGYLGSIPPFKGTFDGNDKTISNLNYKLTDAMPSGTYIGLFGSVENGTIKNLTLNGCTFDSNAERVDDCGAVAGSISKTTISNVTTTSCKVYASKKGQPTVGGIVGTMMTNSRVTGCTVTGTTDNPAIITSLVTDADGGFNSTTGGIAGFCHESVIDDCTVENCTISSNYPATGNGNRTGGIIGGDYAATIHDNMVKGKTSITDVMPNAKISMVGAVYGTYRVDTPGDVPVFYNNYYEKSVTVTCTNTEGTTTLSGYTPRGRRDVVVDDGDNVISVDFNDLTEMVDDSDPSNPVTYKDGAKMYVKPATITGTTTMTFDNTTVGTNCYAGSGKTYYYAPGDPVSVTVTCQQVKNDGRTFYEIASVEMTDGTNDLPFYSNIPPDEFMYANATFPYNFILVTGMPDAEVTINTTIASSDWFTIDTNQQEWMSFYHKWEPTAAMNYTVTDGSGTGKSITALTITDINPMTGGFKTGDLSSTAFHGMPTLFYCKNGLPEKLKFTPDANASTNVVPSRYFNGTTEAKDMSGFTNVYVLNRKGDFFYVDITDTDKTLAAHRCYVALGNTAVVAPARLYNIGGEETGISAPRMESSDDGADWYSLDGRKLEGQPTKKGIYINGGRKVVIK
ncbi:MAG: hypothetical protein IK075_11385 [Prevotella sp.]|nr:hypothetical protein [Prevotella sp.]